MGLGFGGGHLWDLLGPGSIDWHVLDGVDCDACLALSRDGSSCS